MGVPAGIPKTTRRPSHVAYYVALVGILALLGMLCFYFCYFFIKKVRELSRSESLMMQTTSCRPQPPTAYPVQPEVRDGASAMAKLCKQVPVSVSVVGGGGKLGTDTVHPTSTSPAALRTDTGDPSDPAPDPTRPDLPRPDPPRPDPAKPLPVPPPPPADINMQVSAQ